MASEPLISVIIPVYNEEKTIEELLRRVMATPFRKEIILIDDASTDGTVPLLEKFCEEHDNAALVKHLDNAGKGAALRTGFAKVTGDYCIIQDADLEYDPKDFEVVLKPLIEGQAEVVYGSRFLGGPQRIHLFWHYVGNRFLTFLTNVLTNLNLSDMETGYKAFRREVIEGLPLSSNRFGFEPEFTVKIARRKYRIYETPISYHGRGYEEGKKITWRDGIVAIYCLFRYRFFD